MLKSTGLQRVRYDSATEQQAEGTARPAWRLLGGWAGCAELAAGKAGAWCCSVAVLGQCPVRGHALSSCWRGGIFHRAPHGNLLPPRGGLCGVYSVAPSQTGSLTCSPPHFRLPVPSSPSLPSVDCAFLPSWSRSRPGRGKGLAASVRHHRGAGGQGKGARGTRARMEDPLKGELDRAAETEARLQDQEREREPLGGGGWGGGLEPGGSQSCRSRAGRWGRRT